MHPLITQHAISSIANQLKVSSPVVQIVGKIPAQSSGNLIPIKTYISDTEDVLPCHISVEGNESVFPSLYRFCLISIDGISVEQINSKLTIIVNQVKFVPSEVNSKLGNPHNFGKAPSKPDHPSTANMEEVSTMQKQAHSLPDQSHQYQQRQQPPQNTAPTGRVIDSDYHQLPMTPDGTVQTQPISSLTVYSHHSWCIKARVTIKSAVREYTARDHESKGQIQSCDLLDEDGGETRIVFFNDMVDKLGSKMEKGKIYFIHRGSIRVPTNKRFCRFDIEITAGSDTVIVPYHSTPNSGGRASDGSALPDDDGMIAAIKWDFIPTLAMLEPYPADSWCDVCGIVCQIGEVTSITTKFKSQLQKRSLWICDDSMHKLEVTFWGDQATGPESITNQISSQSGDVLSIKSVRVGEFNGKNVSVGNQTIIEVNDTTNERVRQLKQWWTTEGSLFQDKLEPVKGKGTGQFSGQAVPRTIIKRAKDDGAGSDPDRVDLFSIVAAPVYFQRQNLIYLACPTEKCGKKLADGKTCPVCGEQPRGIMKYIVNLNVSDATDSLWINLFSNQAEILIGMTAEALSELQRRSETEYNAKLDSVLFENREWKVRARLDTYNDQRRRKEDRPEAAYLRKIDSDAYCEGESSCETDETQDRKKRPRTPEQIRTAFPSIKYRKKVYVNLSCCKYSVHQDVLNSLGWVETEDEDNWNLFWMDTSVGTDRLKRLRSYQKINHFPGMSEITRKDNLARNMNKLKQQYPKDYQFVPQSWILPHDYFALEQYILANSKCRTLIVKPDASCQGRGIFLTRRLSDLSPNDDCVVQQYLTNPHLINGLKYDLRLYVLVASSNPLRMYLHKKGIIRFATVPFEKPTDDNMDNTFMHLTNYAVNKNNTSYVQAHGDNAASGSKWSHQHYRKYLREEEGVDDEELWKKIEAVCVKTVIGISSILTHTYRLCTPQDSVTQRTSMCFEVLGFDVMIDKHFEPHLIEVNHSPSFTCDTKLDYDVKFSVVKDTMVLINPNGKDRVESLRHEKDKMISRLYRKTFTHKNQPQFQRNRSPNSLPSPKQAQQGFSAPVDPTHDQYTPDFTQFDEWALSHLGGYICIYPIPEFAEFSRFVLSPDHFFGVETISSKTRKDLVLKTQAEKERERGRIRALMFKRDEQAKETREARMRKKDEALLATKQTSINHPPIPLPKQPQRNPTNPISNTTAPAALNPEPEPELKLPSPPCLPVHTNTPSVAEEREVDQPINPISPRRPAEQHPLLLPSVNRRPVTTTDSARQKGKREVWRKEGDSQKEGNIDRSNQHHHSRSNSLQLHSSQHVSGGRVQYQIIQQLPLPVLTDFGFVEMGEDGEERGRRRHSFSVGGGSHPIPGSTESSGSRKGTSAFRQRVRKTMKKREEEIDMSGVMREWSDMQELIKRGEKRKNSFKLEAKPESNQNEEQVQETSKNDTQGSLPTADTTSKPSNKKSTEEDRQDFQFGLQEHSHIAPSSVSNSDKTTQNQAPAIAHASSLTQLQLPTPFDPSPFLSLQSPSNNVLSPCVLTSIPLLSPGINQPQSTTTQKSEEKETEVERKADGERKGEKEKKDAPSRRPHTLTILPTSIPSSRLTRTTGSTIRKPKPRQETNSSPLFHYPPSISLPVSFSTAGGMANPNASSVESPLSTLSPDTHSKTILPFPAGPAPSISPLLSSFSSSGPHHSFSTQNLSSSQPPLLPPFSNHRSLHKTLPAYPKRDTSPQFISFSRGNHESSATFHRDPTQHSRSSFSWKHNHLSVPHSDPGLVPTGRATMERAKYRRMPKREPGAQPHFLPSAPRPKKLAGSEKHSQNDFSV
ncbi:putative Replication protein A 70 kDa DNA-binding subunit [Blattamonas nauphoetae]|uniref:Replication protein A 70 kDa DNA-binding subunit n=1 Tax=Blattamonas nauphoetae TaxID=2049346 RepID=A0ABQ9XCS8_9EUKA|nr:putative Replication protein A 70 kDa DNA-binding subunit [Blattamonas nauphoetae]